MRINYKGVSFLVGEQKTYYIDYDDFEKLVAEVYGIRYSLPFDEELRNNTAFEVGVVDAYKYYNKWEQKHLKDYLEIPDEDRYRHKHYMSGCIFLDLNNRGIIPSGRYIVRASW